jgi:hypothetical protein
MGKKYDAYVKAVKAEDAAKRDREVAGGGSTQARMTEALTNAEQATRNTNDTFTEWLADPEG